MNTGLSHSDSPDSDEPSDRGDSRNTGAKANRGRVWRFALVVSLVAAVVVLATLGWLRWFGYVTAQDYSWPAIIGSAAIVGGIVPLIFWIADRPGMERVFQTIGGLILFGALPAILIWLLIQWLTGIPLF